MQPCPRQFNFNCPAGASGQQGFTLLEVLAAFVVFTVVFTALVQVLSGSIRNTARSQDMTEAALWAQQYLDTLSLERPLEEGSDSGEFDDKYSYEAVINVYQPESVDPQLLEQIPIDMLVVELTVYWGNPERQRQAQFVTMRSVDRNVRENRQLGPGQQFGNARNRFQNRSPQNRRRLPGQSGADGRRFSGQGSRNEN